MVISTTCLTKILVLGQMSNSRLITKSSLVQQNYAYRNKVASQSTMPQTHFATGKLLLSAKRTIVGNNFLLKRLKYIELLKQKELLQHFLLSKYEQETVTDGKYEMILCLVTLFCLVTFLCLKQLCEKSTVLDTGPTRVN